jgi:hypothetical protein
VKTNIDKLRGKFREKRITQEELASRIGMNASTFSRKMKADGLAFTVGQMHKIVEELGITTDEAVQIFLH